MNTFPRTGRVDEIGIGRGKGYPLNAPIREGSPLSDYLYEFNGIFLRAIEKFSSDVVIISARFDPLADDQIGGMKLTPDDFGVHKHITAKSAKVSLAFVLEVGDSPSLGPAVFSIFNALGGGMC